MILKETSLWKGDISQIFLLNIFSPFFTNFVKFSNEIGQNYLIVVILSKKLVAQNNMRMNMFFFSFVLFP